MLYTQPFSLWQDTHFLIKVLFATANPDLSADKGWGWPPSLPRAVHPLRPSLKGPGLEE